jgi:mRNA interferase MazF
MVEKVRPVLIFSVPFGDADRAVVTVVFHSTALRGSEFEVRVQVPFLKDGAFIAQSIATYPTVRAIRKWRMSKSQCSNGWGSLPHKPYRNMIRLLVRLGKCGSQTCST